MYGWRGKIGVLLPSGITVIEGDFRRMVPEGVSCHYHRYNFTGGAPGDEQDVLQRVRGAKDSIGEAVRIVAHARPHLIVMTGTATSFIGGYGYDRGLIDLMEKESNGIPATTTSTSVIAALKHLGVTRVSLASPYVEAAARHAAEFVQGHDIQVMDSKWLGKAGPDIPAVGKTEIYCLAKAADTPESEALFISCTDFNALDLIRHLEIDLGKPVITSNQATMWNMLRIIGIRDRIDGFGQLLFNP
jgi:maleate isomerase